MFRLIPKGNIIGNVSLATMHLLAKCAALLGRIAHPLVLDKSSALTE